MFEITKPRTFSQMFSVLVTYKKQALVTSTISASIMLAYILIGSAQHPNHFAEKWLWLFNGYVILSLESAAITLVVIKTLKCVHRNLPIRTVPAVMISAILLIVLHGTLNGDFTGLVKYPYSALRVCFATVLLYGLPGMLGALLVMQRYSRISESHTTLSLTQAVALSQKQ